TGRQPVAQVRTRLSQDCPYRFAAEPDRYCDLDRILLLYTASRLDIALECLLCIHLRRDCSLPRDLVQRRNQFRILSWSPLLPTGPSFCGPISHTRQSMLLAFPYQTIPSRIRNKDYPTFIGSGLQERHLKDGLIWELCRCKATTQIAHFPVYN